MTENTENTKDKVKHWRRDSIHTTYEAASARADELQKRRKREVPTKIRKQAKGYAVKFWDGEMHEAPAPKSKPQQEISL